MHLETSSDAAVETPEYDAIVIGTGVAGIYQLYRLKERGLRVLALEAGSDVGGVWWWNRYPGARLDSESYSYAYSFSKELREEWKWSEHFASQPELQRYFSHVVDRFDLRRHIAFNSLVTAATFQADDAGWLVRTQGGHDYRCRFLVAAVGPLTSPTYPKIEGRETFEGECYHTSRWPHEPVSFSGKRVAVIGTGATGVQVIQEVAKSAKELFVFQRTPNYCAPLNNAALTESEFEDIKSRYDDIIKRCRTTNSWFIHDADERSVFDLSPEEREEFMEALYAERGIGIWKANFYDIALDSDANQIVSEFMRKKIRERVNDPGIAELLAPQSYGFGLRRVPLETHYYEVFNQENVRLIDVTETPIERITARTLVTSEGEFDVDIIVYATGFDAVTGSFDRIEIRGSDGTLLRDKWRDGPVTFLGVHTSGYPNFFMPGGPLASVGNFTPALEYSVDWITGVLDFMQEHSFTYVDAKPEAELAYTEIAREAQTNLLMGEVKSWSTGVNTNIEGRDQPRVILFGGGAKRYRAYCAAVNAGGYQELRFEVTARRESRPESEEGSCTAAA